MDAEPNSVTQEQRQAIKFVLDDLRSGSTIPGCIDVYNASTGDEITEYLVRTDDERRWDCLAVDYIGHLDVTGRTSDALEEKKKIFRAAQTLALDWRDGRGLFVISPMQANKTSVEKAGEREGKEYGSFSGNYGAVEYFTSAAQDAHLLIGVFQSPEFRKEGVVKISCMKSRGAYFDPFFVKIDPVNRHARTYAAPSSSVECEQPWQNTPFNQRQQKVF